MHLLAQAPVDLQPPTQAVSSNITVGSIVPFIINLLFSIGIIAALAFLIYGGIRWISSGGDKSKVEAARNHIVAAIVGLIIVLAAFLIINIVYGFLTGHSFDFQHICIPSIDNPGCTFNQAGQNLPGVPFH